MNRFVQHLWIASLVLSCLSTSIANANSDIEVTAASPTLMQLGQGQSGDMVLSITNHGPDAALLVPIGGVTTYYFASSYSYPLQMDPQPGCGTLSAVAPNEFHGYSIDVGPLAVGQNVHCTIHVTRASSATNSTTLDWKVFDFADDMNSANNATSFSVGSLTDIALLVEPISFGFQNGVAHAVLRLHATNQGATAVAAFNVNACTDFIRPPFAIDGNFTGGCGSSGHGPTCFDGGFGFQLPALAAGQSESCDLALTGLRTYSGPEVFELRIEQPLYNVTRNGSVIDTNAGNDIADLILAASIEPAPAMRMLALIVLCLGLLSIAASRSIRISAKEKTHEF